MRSKVQLKFSLTLITLLLLIFFCAVSKRQLTLNVNVVDTSQMTLQSAVWDEPPPSQEYKLNIDASGFSNDVGMGLLSEPPRAK